MEVYRAIEMRVQFEQNRHIKDPRALATLLADAQEQVRARSHPDPYRREPFASIGSTVHDRVCFTAPLFPDGTKW